MTWGTFSALHIATLLLGVAINVALYFLLRRTSMRTKTVVLGILSLSGIAAILYNLLMWGSPLEYLPFHLCSISALVLPFAVWLRSERLGNLLLLWSLGALFALIVNHSMASVEVPSVTFAFYYLPHVLEFGIPILLFRLGMIRMSPRCIGSTLAITGGSYALIHLINVGINHYCEANALLNSAGEIIRVNYMFSITPENPLLSLFYRLIPHPFWYMLLLIPVAGIYLGAIYGVRHWLLHRKGGVRAAGASAA